MLFKTDNYQSFLDKLHQITNIDIRILDNLRNLNLLQFIFEDKNSISIIYKEYTIDNPILIPDYQHTTEYVLASFPIYNDQYKIKGNIYQFKSIINDSSKPKILLTSEYSSIHCYYSISLNRFSKYPIKNFNNTEKKMFKDEIRKIFKKYSYLGFFSFADKQDLILNPSYLPEDYFLRYKEDNIEDHLQSLSNFISECILNYQIIEDEIKKIDFPIYERLILSNEIKDF